MIEQSPEIKDLAQALLTFQAEVRGVEKDSKNPHFKNRYASLEAVVEAARPGLQKVGVVFLQAPGQVVNGSLEVSTMLIHASTGQWMRSTMQIPMAKVDPQGAGSAVTYAQRYSLMAALGIPPVEHLDDDAEKAMGRSQPTVVASKTAQALKNYKQLETLMTDCTTIAALKKVATDYAADIEALTPSEREDLKRVYQFKAEALKKFGEAA